MIKYLGSKRMLIPLLMEAIAPTPSSTVLDLFSGTSRVGFALKERGARVIANDHNAYAHRIAETYVAADAETHADDAQALLDEMSALPARPGYFTKTFCEQARFVHPKNGGRIDAMRAFIAEQKLPRLLESVVITALIEAADRVDSTCGVQMAYLKQWAPRATKPLTLRLPTLLPRAAAGAGRAWCSDALAAAQRAAADGPVDVAYLDPPYNQHSYLGNYHVWETLARGDTPEAYGVAQKRIDVKARKSAFNRKREHKDAFYDVVRNLSARRIVVSFSDEGFLTKDELVTCLSERGDVHVHTQDYRRYIGAQIGVYNPAGERVGEPKKLKNQEYVFVVDCHDRADRDETGRTAPQHRA